MNMIREVLLGALMAVIVTFLFLRNVRTTLIAVISIPLSMMATVIMLNVLGYTLNMMTLAGIAIAVGRVVDDSIVIIENIFRRIHSAKQRSKTLIESATTEVATAITSSTLATVAVFLPLAFVPGIVGDFFVPLAWTVVFALLFSLLVSVTVVPLFSRLFLINHLKAKEARENKIQKGYRRLLRWSLRRRFVTLLIAAAALGASCAIIPLLGFTFLPEEKVENYEINLRMPIGSQVYRTNDVVQQIEKMLDKYDEIEAVRTSVGNESAGIALRLKNTATGSSTFTKQLRAELAQLTGVRSISLSGVGSIIGGGSSFSIVVNGPNEESIQQAAEQISSAIRQVPGTAEVRTSAEGEKPEINVTFNEKRLAELGVTPSYIGNQIQRIIDGMKAGEMQLDGRPVPIIITTQSAKQADLIALNNQLLLMGDGSVLPIKDVATLTVVKNPNIIQHLNRAEYLEVNGRIVDNNRSKVTEDIQQAIAKLKLPSGVTWSSEGAESEMNDGFVNMGIAIAISVFLVYIVMLLAFGEATIPFIILFAMPFSLIGSLIGLFIVNEPIGMPALIGILMLNGIVVTNAIILLEKTQQNLRNGYMRHLLTHSNEATLLKQSDFADKGVASEEEAPLSIASRHLYRLPISLW